MKRWSLIYLILGFGLVSCKNESRFLNDENDTSITASDRISSRDTVAMNKAWADYMEPSASHKMLSEWTGRWDAEISFYYDPDSPSINRSIVESKMIMGGRYLQSAYMGTIDGMLFEGVGTLAYDNAKKIFISSWLDNMGTGLMYLEGNYDPEKRQMILNGHATDVITGEDIKLVQKIKVIDEESQLSEMYETKDGMETKTMSILLTKK